MRGLCGGPNWPDVDVRVASRAVPRVPIVCVPWPLYSIMLASNARQALTPSLVNCVSDLKGHMSSAQNSECARWPRDMGLKAYESYCKGHDES